MTSSITKKIIEIGDKLTDEIIKTRRWIHQHPELSTKEFETQKFIEKKLKSLGLKTERMAETGTDVDQIKEALISEAIKIHTEEVESTRKLSQFGAELIEDGFTVLTHCNTGPLATTGYGTALGVIIQAKEQGRKVKVFTPETRPLLQGARLTT